MITQNEQVLQRNLSTSPQEEELSRQLEIDWAVFFEIESTVAFILSEPIYQNICLQFPDEWLVHSTVVAKCLTERTGRRFYVLADTTFGSCCVDEIAAKHVQADLIVHYGQSCKSLITGKIPVKFIYGRAKVDLSTLSTLVAKEKWNEKVFLAADVRYEHCLEDLKNILEQGVSEQTVAEQTVTEQTVTEPGVTEPGVTEQREVEIYQQNSTPSSSSILLYVGLEGPGLTHLLITLAHTGLKIYSFNPITGGSLRLESAQVNKSLMKRYVLVQKAKDAQIIGILIATLSTARYMEALEFVKSLCRRAGRKYYTLVMGKLNPAKLANFPEVDIFVMITCPFYSLLDNKEFYRPVITPFELDLALTKGLEWTGEFIDSFQDLLKRPLKESNPKGEEEEDFPHFSLITGTLKNSNHHHPSSKALVQQEQQLQLASSAEYFTKRTYQGLDPDLENTKVQAAQPGRHGTAKGYQSEAGYENL